MKELLCSLCEHLQMVLNLGGEKNIVKLDSGTKPSNYFLPQMHIGTTKTITDKVDLAWFVEIYVNDKCIFRETDYRIDFDNELKTEARACKRLIDAIFCYGVMSAKKFMEEINNKNHQNERTNSTERSY